MKIALLLLLSALPAFAVGRSRVSGWCEQGNQTIKVLGYTSATSTPVQGSAPSCTVTVYLPGTTTLANIYSDDNGTALTNPFTVGIAPESSSIGYWFFYANNGIYDVNFSGTGIPTAFTKGAIPNLNPQLIGGVAYADTFAGSDACAKISAAITAANTFSGSFGGTVDARAFTGLQSCSSNPFGSSTGGITLLLGAATFRTTTAWIVPNKSRVIGIGRGDPASLNTVVQANSSSFPASTAVVQMCSASANPCFGVQVESLSIDCNGVTGCVGGYNAYAQEQSWFRHVLVENAAGVGIFVDGAPPYGTGGGTFASQNSGPYSDLEVLPGSATVTGTICFEALLVAAWRGVFSLTCNSDGGSVNPTNGLFIDGTAPGHISDIHVEHWVNGVVLGAAHGSDDIVIENIQGGPSTTNVVVIQSGANTSQDIMICGVGSGNVSANLIVDQVNSNTLTNTVGSGCYMTGIGSSGTQTVLTTRTDIAMNIQTSLRVLKNLSIPGTAANDAAISFGLGPDFKILSHTSPSVAGQLGPVIQTGGAPQGHPCFLVQGSDVTQGAPGGGLCLNGTGFGLDPAFGQVGAGYTGDGGTFTARAATAASTSYNDGAINFYSDSGLTPGSPFTPTRRFSINLGHLNTYNAIPDSVGTVVVTASTTGSHSFATAWSVAPLCVITPVSDPGSRYWVTTTTSAITANLSSSGSATFGYICMGTPN